MRKQGLTFLVTMLGALYAPSAAAAVPLKELHPQYEDFQDSFKAPYEIHLTHPLKSSEGRAEYETLRLKPEEKEEEGSGSSIRA